MPRHRLFRRRTSWGPVRDNLHVVVTVAALIATAFAWNAISNADQPPTPQVASSDLEISPATALASSSSTATEKEMRVTATAKMLPAPVPSAHSGEPTAPPPLPKATPLLHGQPSSITDASPGIAPPTALADPAKIRGKHRQARHRLRRNNAADRNPFDCRVRRNKPPCFDENDRQ